MGMLTGIRYSKRPRVVKGPALPPSSALQEMVDEEKRSSAPSDRDMLRSLRSEEDFEAIDVASVAMPRARPLATIPAGEECGYCLDTHRWRHTVVATGTEVYLAVPWAAPLVPGHCLLAPLTHEVSGVALDEGIMEEIYVFKRRLETMYAARGQFPVFLEWVGRGRERHWQVEVVPVPQDLLGELRIWFKRSLLDQGGVNGTNKVSETDHPRRPLRTCVPKGFPYFHVEFGADRGGYAMVVEDHTPMDWKFGKEVLCAVLDIPAQLVLRHRSEPQPLDQATARKDALEESWAATK